jgi:hypothetical protein
MGVEVDLKKPESGSSVNFGAFYRPGLYSNEKDEYELLFPITFGAQLGNNRSMPRLNLGICPGLGSENFKNDRVYFIYVAFVAGITQDFYLGDKIHLYTDLNYSAGFFSLSIGYGFK